MVICVDSNDCRLGVASKRYVHENGVLHRAFSVFLYDPNGMWLLQRRAQGKYHSAGLWTNACCSHPAPGMETRRAATVRLRQEMGIRAELEYAGALLYRAQFDNSLTEYEYDHIFIGVTGDRPRIDPSEADACRYVSSDDLLIELTVNPERFTVWFRLITERFADRLFSHNPFSPCE